MHADWLISRTKKSSVTRHLARFQQCGAPFHVQAAHCDFQWPSDLVTVPVGAAPAPHNGECKHNICIHRVVKQRKATCIWCGHPTPPPASPWRYFWLAVSAVWTPCVTFYHRWKRNTDLPSHHRPAMRSHASSASVHSRQRSCIHSSVCPSSRTAAKLNSTLRIHAAGSERRAAGCKGGRQEGGLWLVQIPMKSSQCSIWSEFII